MATAQENLITAYNNVAQQLADISASPKPTYSIDGKSVSWTEHFNALIDKQMALLGAIQAADGAFEVRSEGVF